MSLTNINKWQNNTENNNLKELEKQLDNVKQEIEDSFWEKVKTKTYNHISNSMSYFAMQIPTLEEELELVESWELSARIIEYRDNIIENHSIGSKRKEEFNELFIKLYHIYLQGYLGALKKFTTQEIDEIKEDVEDQLDTILWDE